MKKIFVLIILFYLLSCNQNNKLTAKQFYEIAQKHRINNEIKDAITNYKHIINNFPKDNYSAIAQFQIADIYLNDAKNFEYAIKEFKIVLDNYPDNEVAKKSLFMIAYIYNNYINAYTDAINYYKLFKDTYPNDELIPSVEYELKGLDEIINKIESINNIQSKENNL